MMISESEKFRAETIRLGGIALLAPIGKFFYNPFEIFNQYKSIICILFIIYSIGFAYLGLIFIAKSYDIMHSKYGNDN